MIELMIVGAVVVLVTIVCTFAWFRIVDPSEAHLVATPSGKFVVSSDDKVGDKRTYFAIPSWIPFVGRTVRMMDVTIKEILNEQETIEEKQARYNVTSSTKYRITDVKIAAETYITENDLKSKLTEIVRAGVRAITVKYNVQDARAKKQEMEIQIKKEIADDFAKWGLEVINFQLVEFKDTKDSKIISNISKRREIEIETMTREENAEKIKQAKIKEAEAEEKSRSREIEKDKVIAEQEQEKEKFIAIKRQKAEEERFKVVKIQTIEQAKIDKEKAIIEAKQKEETEKILMAQKKLEGQGDRARAEERAKGDAAPILEKGLAEAKAKDALQEALNKFGDDAIRALVAEKVVEKDKEVGIATAKALEHADVKVFSGGESDRQGFDLGKIISAASVSNNQSADAILNKLSRPNDMGFTALGMKSVAKSKDDTVDIKTESKTDEVLKD